MNAITARRVEKIGNATLYLGDCREVLPGIGAVDAVVTDPPYGLNFAYASYTDTRDNLRDLIAAFMPWSRKNAARIVVMPGITQVYLYPEPDWIMAVCWNTTGSFGTFGFTQWMPVLLYGKDLKGFGSVNGGILKSDVILFSGGEGVGFRRAEKIDHPCPKPLNLMDNVIVRLSEPGHVIADPFMGSGSTGVAAVKKGRKFVGVEMDPGYFDVACRRIEAAQRQADLFVSTMGDGAGATESLL
jgi:site-specific DNA-methyltransferase (adenine-specific)/modification methylase